MCFEGMKTDTTMSSSFDDLIARLARGEDDAQAEMFRRFSFRLIRLARARLDLRLQKFTDPEDITQSVWKSFFLRQADGEFEFRDWDGLWAMLTTITIRKCIRESVASSRQKRDLKREVSIQQQTEGASSFELPIVDREPTPQESAMLSECIEQLLTGLTEKEKEIVVLRLQGHTIPEISEHLQITERTIHRKLAAVRERLGQLI